MRTAVVVDVGWVNGLAAVRSLGRAGIRVLALDHRESALGFRSRYAEPVLTPDPQDEPAYVDFLAGLDVEGAPVFATHDEPLNAIARCVWRVSCAPRRTSTTARASIRPASSPKVSR